jgi:hypothetical protein
MPDSAVVACDDATEHQLMTMIRVHQCELQQIDTIIPHLLQPDIIAMYSRRRRILQDAIADLQQQLEARRDRG